MEMRNILEEKWIIRKKMKKSKKKLKMKVMILNKKK
jgi:hypothetical protein